MKETKSLFTDISKRYDHKKAYEKKETYYPTKEKFNMIKYEEDLIQLKVENMCNEIISKYEVKESELYEKLYLRVRKLFLELM